MAGISEADLNELLLESLRQGRQAAWRIASNSMAPLIEAGDRVIVEPYAAEEAPTVGDIVLIRAHDKWLVHRLVGRVRMEGRVFFRQKGDSGLRAQSVPRDAIFGRVVHVKKSRSRERIDLTSGHRLLLNRVLGVLFSLVDWLIRQDDLADTDRTSSRRRNILRTCLSRTARGFEGLITKAAAALYGRSRPPEA